MQRVSHALASTVRAEADNDRIWYYFSVSLLMALLLVTQNYPDFEFTIEHGFSDQKTYVAIAGCHLHNNCGELFASYSGHWLQRWAPNILVGAFSDIAGINLWTAYRICVFSLIPVSAIIIEKLEVRFYDKLAYFAFVIFFPYGFRLFLFAPAMIADTLFYFSLIALCVGLQIKKNKLIYVSTSVPTLIE
jgi:hypothetical protein